MFTEIAALASILDRNTGLRLEKRLGDLTIAPVVCRPIHGVKGGHVNTQSLPARSRAISVQGVDILWLNITRLRRNRQAA